MKHGEQASGPNEAIESGSAGRRPAVLGDPPNTSFCHFLARQAARWRFVPRCFRWVAENSPRVAHATDLTASFCLEELHPSPDLRCTSQLTRHLQTAGMVLLASVLIGYAVTPSDQGNPYDAIVGRNVFSLKPPPPPPNPEDLIKKDPPPKIRLQGLTTILGRRQVLFKSQTPAKPGQPAKDESYVLSEGERQGEIEVVAIDENAGTVKFNNHGTPETLNMKDDADKPVLGAAPPPVTAPPGGVPRPVPGVPQPAGAVNPVRPAPGSVTTFGGSPGSIPQRQIRGTSVTAGGLPAGLSSPARTTQQSGQQSLTPEQQVVIMEVQREHNRGNPNFPPLPPTPYAPTPPPLPQ